MADSKYKLTYFNVKGLAECIRFLFAYADVDFEDNRIEKEDWPAMKEKQPYGTLPVLEVDGKILNQSVTMMRFLGKRFGLVAEDPFTEALLEALVDNLRDTQAKLKESIANKTPESEKAAHEALKYILDKFEKLLPEGYLYGSKPTWVDIYVTGLFETINDYIPNILSPYPNLTGLVEKIKSKDGIKKYIKQRPVQAPHPH
ncbi:glutathione S-transferase 1-like [Arctopsyche grandis]|uniref:glutathione S-transferase 1-like n=1 Tax=Arctopsyche grandis TaxID=121162 RepID=UPI00406D7B64